MCWNLEISVVAAVYGFGISYYLSQRGYSTRDPWYGLFLATFTTTQLFDALFWAMTDIDGTLECTDWNSGVSRFILPFAIFFQPWVLASFPSQQCMRARLPVKVLSVCGALLLALVWGCTTFYETTGYMKVPTLLYGGKMPPMWLMLVGVAFWASAITLFAKPYWVGRNILLVGGFNVILLIVIDGTIRLLSKLCFYCLLLSILWLLEPWLYPGSGMQATDEKDSNPNTKLSQVSIKARESQTSNIAPKSVSIVIRV